MCRKITKNILYINLQSFLTYPECWLAEHHSSLFLLTLNNTFPHLQLEAKLMSISLGMIKIVNKWRHFTLLVNTRLPYIFLCLIQSQFTAWLLQLYFCAWRQIQTKMNNYHGDRTSRLVESYDIIKNILLKQTDIWQNPYSFYESSMLNKN